MAKSNRRNPTTFFTPDHVAQLDKYLTQVGVQAGFSRHEAETISARAIIGAIKTGRRRRRIKRSK